MLHLREDSDYADATAFARNISRFFLHADSHLFQCQELLIFPPETLPSRLENLRWFTAMSRSQAKYMIYYGVRCLTFSDETITNSVNALAGAVPSPHRYRLRHDRHCS